MHYTIPHRMATLLVVPILLLSAPVLSVPGHAHAAGSIQLSPTTVQRGDHVNVNGGGFTPNDAVVISTGFHQFNGQSRYVQVTPHTNNMVQFLSGFNVPGNIRAGVYTVTARDFHGNRTTAQLTVLPLVYFNPNAKKMPSTSVVAGGFFFAEGTGFAPGEQVQVTGAFPLYNGNSVNVSHTVQANSRGNFRDMMLQIPLDARTGNITMTATGGASGHKATSNVNVVYHPKVSLNAATFRPGQSVTMTGKGFIPSTSVHISVKIPNGASTITVAKDVQTDSNGAFTTSLDLPSTAPAGTYPITAVGTLIGLKATSRLVVGLQPTVTLASASVIPGHSVKVTGGGFGSNVKVNVTATFPLYGGGSKTQTKTFITDTNGNFSGWFYVPGRAAAGTVTLAVNGPNTQAKTSLQVGHIVASVRLTPSTLVPGSTVTVKGAGYAANDKVDISLPVTMTDGSHRTLTATAQANKNGDFSVTVAIPGDVATGDYSVVARSEATGRAPSAKLHLSVAGRLTLQPANPQPGHTVTVRGVGFGAHVSVTVSVTFPMYAGGTKTVSKTVHTNGSGNLTASISVPRQASAGAATVVAQAPNSRVTATLHVSKINASITAAPVSAIPGATVYVHGAGYLAGSHIDITVTVNKIGGGAQTLTARAVTAGNGMFSVPVKIPSDAAGGTYTVTAKSEESGRASTARLVIVTLKASIVAAPTAVAPGAQVTVNGFGYAAGSTVTLTLNGQNVGSATTDGSGKFTAKLTIPATSATGVYTLQAIGVIGRSSTASITVNRQISTHFYFASLYTGTNYHEYLTILNPTSIRARVTITYEPKVGPTKSKTIVVNPTSRFTEDVNADLGPKVSTSAVIAADVPISAARLVYHQIDGSVVPGVTAPATRWYFANGNTSGKYREYIAVQNPSNSQIQVAFRLLPTHHKAFTVYRTMTPMSRTTIKVNKYVKDADGVIVSSGTPIVANRTVFIHHGMNSKIGVTAPNRTWYFAAGPSNTTTHNYIGLINTANAWSHVTLHIYGPYGAELKTITANLKPLARTYWLMNRVVGQTDVAVLVQTSQPSVAEQQTYADRMHDASSDSFGVTAPAKMWSYAAVNTTNGSDTLNVFNPNLAPVPVVVQFMTSAGRVTQRTYVISPLSHQRIDVRSVVPNAELGLVITSNQPVVTLNRVYFNHKLGSDTTTGVST